MKTFIRAAAFSLIALSAAPAANAATEVFKFIEVDPAAGLGTPSSFGAITVSTTSTGLSFVETLTGDYTFRAAPDSNHQALTFDLSVGGKTVTGLTLPFVQATLGSKQKGFTNQPFGSAWNYAIDCPRSPSACAPGGTSNPTTLSFSIAGISLADIVSAATYGGKKVYFATDVVNKKTGKTGSVGAVAFVAVPEPGVWSMMILGVGAIGVSLRRNRRQAVVSA